METKLERLRNYLSPVYNYFELMEQLANDDMSMEEAVDIENKTNREYKTIQKILPKIKELLDEENTTSDAEKEMVQ